MNIVNNMKKYLCSEKSEIELINIEVVRKIFDILDNSRKSNKKIYICGNGGSASTASHFACDFNNASFFTDGKKFNFICINEFISSILATANDYSFDRIFEFYLEGRIEREDILMAISCSGNSSNIINATKYARNMGAVTIGLTGFDGGELANIVDYHFNVPNNNIRIVEDIHLVINHVLIDCFRNEYEGARLDG